MTSDTDGNNSWTGLIRSSIYRLLILLLIYTAGWLAVSPSLLAVAVIVTAAAHLWRRGQEPRGNRVARSIAEHGEPAIILSAVKDLPSWVHFPDVERVEWLNKIIHRLWPYAGLYIGDQLMSSWQRQLADILASYKLYNFKFNRVHLGDRPPRIGGVKMYPENLDSSKMMIDMQVFYPGNARVECSVNYMSVGVKDIQLCGWVRVVLGPMVGTVPLVGGIQVFFLDRPELDFNLLGVTNLLDMPGLSGIVRDAIGDVLASSLVMPNKWSAVLAPLTVSPIHVNCPQPTGVLRVRIVEARDLVRKDVSIFSAGSSDPYAVISIGSRRFKTKYLNSTVDPVWNYVCEAVLEREHATYQLLVVDLFDRDKGPSDDDFLGRCSIDISGAVESGVVDSWLSLEQTTSGRVRVHLEWLNLSRDPADLTQQLLDVDALRVYDNCGLSSAVLVVFVHSASNLPLSVRSARSVAAYVRVSTDGEVCAGDTHDELTQRTSVCTDGDSGGGGGVVNDESRVEWQQGFLCPLSNPAENTLSLRVIDETTDRNLGSYDFPIAQLLLQPQLQLCDHQLQLNTGSSNKLAQLTVTLQLHIFNSNSLESAGNEQVVKNNTINQHDIQTDSILNESSQKIISKTDPNFESTVDAVDNAINDMISDNLSNNDTAVSSCAPQKTGRLLLAICYDKKSSALFVRVVRAIGLNSEQDGDSLAVYIKIYLLPAKMVKRKTKVVSDSCGPEFNDTLQFEIASSQIDKSVLEIRMMSRTAIAKRDDTILVTRLKLSDLAALGCEEQQVWLDLATPSLTTSDMPRLNALRKSQFARRLRKFQWPKNLIPKKGGWKKGKREVDS